MSRVKYRHPDSESHDPIELPATFTWWVLIAHCLRPYGIAADSRYAGRLGVGSSDPRW